MYFENLRDFKNLKASDVKRLQGFNLRHAEQLVALLASSSGREALKQLRLESGFAEIDKSASAWLKTQGQGQKLLAAGLTVSELTAEEARVPYSFGYNVTLHDVPLTDGSLQFGDEMPTEVFRSFSSEFSAESELAGREENASDSLPKQHIVFVKDFSDKDDLPRARNQGERGACAAFTGCHMFESYLRVKGDITTLSINKDRATLSPQYLYYRVKQNDQIPSEGTKLNHVMSALSEYGVCTDSELEYVRHHDWGQSEIFANRKYNLDDVNRSARQNKVLDFKPLDPFDIAAMKKHLYLGHTIGLGVPIFEDAWFNNYSHHRGEIQIPLFRKDKDGKVKILDNFRGGHAITLYGYVDNGAPETEGSNVGRAGGGYFIFRNSWGSGWARSDSESPKGYGLLPYEYVRLFAMEAVIITGVKVQIGNEWKEF